MGKQRKEDPPPPGAPAWMTTFGDLMNLLLCFFVLLFSMSSVDAKKFDELVESLNSSLSIFSGGASAIGEGLLISNGASQLNELADYVNSTGYNEEGEPAQETLSEAAAEVEQEQLEASEELAGKIEEALAERNIGDEVSLTFTSQYTLLTLNGELLFDSGDVTIKEAAFPVLDQVGSILERFAEGTIHIEGHTDNMPMNGAKYSDNLELSQGRAVSVYRYFMEHTVLHPENISAAGRGEYIPIADNETAEGRAKNRRVEIRIYHSLSTMD